MSKTILDVISDFVIVLSPDFKVKYFNSKVADLYEWTQKKSMNKELFGLFQDNSNLCPIPAEELKACLKQYHQIEHQQIIKTDSLEKVILWKIHKTNATIFFVGNDQTALMQIDKEKRMCSKPTKTEQLFYEVLDAISVGIYWKNRQGQYLGCNQHVLDMIGIKDRQNIIGKSDRDLAWKDTASILEQIDQSVMQNQMTYEIEETPYIANGQEKIYLTTKSPIYDQISKVIGIIGVSVDITERKRTESELKKTKEALEAANARIKAMAGSIAHELRTPLGTVGMNIGAVDSALTDPTEENLSYAHETLASIRKEIESANTVINMLLMNIREDVNWKNEKMEPCSMNQCIEEALNRYPFQEGQKEKVTWKKSKDFEFQGNALFMQHVIFNLLKNALYQIATEGKGDIEIWTEQKNNEFQLHFKDTAKGIPADVLPRIFEKFFTNTKKGTGLGLAFCKMVIEAFGGIVSSNSEEGKFTEFIIKFSGIKNKSKKL